MKNIVKITMSFEFVANIREDQKPIDIVKSYGNMLDLKNCKLINVEKVI